MIGTFHLLRFGLSLLVLAQENDAPDLISLALQFMALVGAAGLIAVLVNIGKTIGIVHDGQAPAASLILNFIGMGLLLVLRVFRPDVDIAAVDGMAQTIATFLIAALGLFTQIMSARLIHDKGLKGQPVIGRSNSLMKGEMQG